MEKVVIDPLWVVTTLVGVIGICGGWYIVRLDQMVEHLRDEIIGMQKDIGKLQNADVTCTNDQTILKQDMSAIRDTMLKVIARRFMRKGLRREWREKRRESR